jgi:DUF4097 and DUF4098 domain-containing protein YvlB
MSWTSFASRPARTAGATAVLALALTAAPAVAQVEGKFERTLKVSGTVDLSVTSGSGSIHVMPGASGTVRVVGTIRANRWRNRRSSDVEARIKRIEADPPVVQEGSRVSIGKTGNDDLYENISISYEVYAPDTTTVSANTGSGSVNIGALRGPVTASSGSGSVQIGATGGAVKASTGSGEITVDGAKERVEASTGSGSIRLRNIAGAAAANSGSGGIEVEQTAAGPVRLTTGSGGIRAWGIRGELVARASSGSIHVQGTPTGPWDLDSSSGSITMELPASVAFTLDAHTGSGSINVDHPITVQGRIDRRTLRGNVNGGGPTVSASTSSGSIDIDTAAAAGSPKAK